MTSRSGPHVTLQAGVLHLGRQWTTTTRASVKAAAIRRTRRAATAVGEDGRCHLIGGEAIVLDPAHPATFAADLFATALAGGAVLRLGMGRLDQLRGYAEAGTAVPISFLPTGRVLLVIRIQDELVIDGDDVLSATGQWARDRPVIQPLTGYAHRWTLQHALADVPEKIAALAHQSARGWLGVETISGAVALPADWEPTTGHVRVGRGVLAAVGAALPGPICVTLDESHHRRPDEKIGVMLRGTGVVVDADDTSASVALKIDRVTHWCGFDTTTTSDQAA